MGTRNFKSWKTAFLLSIIVLVSLLTTFKLTGLIEKPITIAETITLEPVNWELLRPDENVNFIRIIKYLNSTHADADCLMAFNLLIGMYLNNAYAGSFDILDGVINVNATMINQNSYIKNVYVVKNEDSETAIDWLFGFIDFKNLSLTGYGYGKKAYINLKSLNNPRSCYLKASFNWYMPIPNNQTHQMNLLCEITYYNGSVYKKIIQPFNLKLVGS